jgi:hypothetical protein
MILSCTTGVTQYLEVAARANTIDLVSQATVGRRLGNKELLIKRYPKCETRKRKYSFLSKTEDMSYFEPLLSLSSDSFYVA